MALIYLLLALGTALYEDGSVGIVLFGQNIGFCLTAWGCA